jgi:hypothetical protein
MWRLLVPSARPNLLAFRVSPDGCEPRKGEPGKTSKVIGMWRGALDSGPSRAASIWPSRITSARHSFLRRGKSPKRRLGVLLESYVF